MCKKFKKDVAFGFEASVIDGSEHIFGTGEYMKELPKSYSYRNFLPGVIDQGAQSICVPCSISAWLNWRENLKTGSKTDNKINYQEIYRIRSNNSDDGMTFKEAFRYLRHNGVSSNCGTLKIREYAMIRNLSTLKVALLMNGPCLGALPVYNDRPEFWNKMNGDGFYGYHAISIVGYNEDGFIIRNSWGTSFGNRGYTVLKYEDYPKMLEVWTIVD